MKDALKRARPGWPGRSSAAPTRSSTETRATGRESPATSPSIAPRRSSGGARNARTTPRTSPSSSRARPRARPISCAASRCPGERRVRLGLGYPQIEAAGGLARLEVRAGAAAKAEPLARRAVQIARGRRDDATLGQALLAVVEVEAALGRADRARAALDEARGAAGRVKDADLEAECAAAARRLDSR